MSSEHERGFEAGYSAAIHDARVPGSRARAELHPDYNGWTGGYPTWVSALWIDNEPATYEHARDLAREAAADEHPRAALADALRDWIRPRIEPETACLQADLLGWALDGVDWFEIADAFLEEIREDEPGGDRSQLELG